MAEVYWMALARDIPFNDFATDALTCAAAGNNKRKSGVTEGSDP